MRALTILRPLLLKFDAYSNELKKKISSQLTQAEKISPVIRILQKLKVKLIRT